MEDFDKVAKNNRDKLKTKEKQMNNRLGTSAKSQALPMVFTSEAFKAIESSVGRLKPETGGILLGYRSDYVVRKFIFDKEGSFQPSAYDPNVNYLNPFLKTEWHSNRYELIGFVHSHPRGAGRLSGDWGNGIGDIGYLKLFFEKIKGLEKFLVPIVYSTHDGHPFKMFPFIAWKGAVENYQKATLEILKKNIPRHKNRREYAPHSIERIGQYKHNEGGPGCGSRYRRRLRID